jgi:hypothetical protein
MLTLPDRRYGSARYLALCSIDPVAHRGRSRAGCHAVDDLVTGPLSSEWNLSRWFNFCVIGLLAPVYAGRKHAMKQSLPYLATAAAIAIAVWVMTGAPMQTHPDARVAQTPARH